MPFVSDRADGVVRRRLDGFAVDVERGRRAGFGTDRLEALGKGVASAVCAVESEGSGVEEPALAPLSVLTRSFAITLAIFGLSSSQREAMEWLLATAVTRRDRLVGVRGISDAARWRNTFTSRLAPTAGPA